MAKIIRGLKASTRRLLQAGQRKKVLPPKKRKAIASELKTLKKMKVGKGVLQEAQRTAIRRGRERKIIFR